MKKRLYLYFICLGMGLSYLIQSCVNANSQQPASQPLLGFRAYTDKAEFYFNKGEFQPAYAHLDTAINQAEKEGNWLWVGRISVRYVQVLGLLMNEKILTNEAANEKIAAINQKLGEYKSAFPAIEGYIISNQHISDFNPELALTNANKLIELAEKEQEWGLVLQGNLPVSRFLYQQKRFEELKKLVEKIEIIYTKHIENEAGLNVAFPAWAYSDFYDIRLKLDYANADAEAAEKTLKTHIAKLENYKYPAHIALFNVYNNLSSVCYEKRDYNAAVLLREKSLNIFTLKAKLNNLDSAQMASAWVGLASDYIFLKQYKKGLNLAIQTIAVYENLDYNNKSEGFINKCAYYLATAYLWQATAMLNSNSPKEQVDLAITKFRNYLPKLSVPANMEEMRYNLYELEVNFALKKNNHAEAIKILNEFEKYQQKNKETNSLHILDYQKLAAETYLLASQPLKSVEAAQKQFLIIQKTDKPFNLWAVADFDSLPNKFFALTASSQQLKSLTALVRQDSSYWANDSFVQSYWQTAKLCTRLFDYNLIHLNSEKSQAEFIQNLYETYDNAMEVGANLYQKTQDSSYLNQVWNWSEQTKSIFLLQTLYGEQRQQFAGVPDSVVREEQRLRRNLVYYEQQLNNAKRSDTAQYNRLKNTLSQIQTQQTEFNERIKTAYPKYHQLQYASPLAQIADVQKILSDSSQMLSFWVGNEYFYLFAISKQKTKLQKYPAAAAQNLLNELIPLYTDPESDLAKLKNRSLRLYQNYLAPSIDSNKNELAIVADGLFNYLPFEALVASDFGKDAAREWDYLLQKYKISYHYSASLYQMLQTRESQASNWQILGMAADYKPQDNLYQQDSSLSQRRSPSQKLMRKGLAPLKGAADEINKLPELYRGYFVVGETATEQEFVENAPYYGILHLAMHNVVDGDNPELSALVFTENGDTLNDNFLQSYEVKNLDLYADLVILSACETGFGKYQRGEGVVSVGRSFIYAGASSLLVSLWSLNDYTAPVITAKFYEYLQQGFSKTEALQRAKLDYLQTAKGDAAHPALWACLVQMGNTENISPSRRITIWWYLIPLGAVALVGLWARNALKQRRKF